MNGPANQAWGTARSPLGSLGGQFRRLRQQFTAMPSGSVNLAGLAGKMQQEAARQDTDRQNLAAQQAANEHLRPWPVPPAAAGLRVQVVGAAARNGNAARMPMPARSLFLPLSLSALSPLSS